MLEIKFSPKGSFCYCGVKLDLSAFVWPHTLPDTQSWFHWVSLPLWKLLCVFTLDKEEMLWCCPGRLVMMFFCLWHSLSREWGGGEKVACQPFLHSSALAQCSQSTLDSNYSPEWLSPFTDGFWSLLFWSIPSVGLGEGPSSWYKFAVLLSSTDVTSNLYILTINWSIMLEA